MRPARWIVAGALVLTTLCALPGAARPRSPQPPDACQRYDETGAVITIGWNLEGCNADRAAFALRIVDRTNHPGFYPPFTCSLGRRRFDWPAPACAHARNLYLRGTIRPQYYGRRPSPQRAPPPTPAALPSMLPSALPSPLPTPTRRS